MSDIFQFCRCREFMELSDCANPQNPDWRKQYCIDCEQEIRNPTAYTDEIDLPEW